MRSVRTTFQILDAVANNQPIGLSQLARRLDLPKSSVQRSLARFAGHAGGAAAPRPMR
jgi:IclR family transcriptional regulator, acetate operon repressor